jgi:thioredoxin 1
MQQINSVDFKAQVIDSSLPVLVDFFATWCGPCQMQTPVLEELSGVWNDKVKIIKVDVDQNQELAGEYGVMSIPTIIIFKAGQPINQLIGFQAKEKLETIFNEVCK